MRDPRVDPRNGDILESRAGCRFRVVGCDQAEVAYIDLSEPAAGVLEVRLDYWRKVSKSDRVIKRGPCGLPVRQP